MTCKHPGGASNPNCSSHPDHPENPSNRRYEEERRRSKEVEQMTPDAEKYQIVQFARFGGNVVMRVLYPNCSKCSYEGHKVMVFLNVVEADVVQWGKIDPHFRDPKKPKSPAEAPGPAARFPASTEGWDDACEYAQRKANLQRR